MQNCLEQTSAIILLFPVCCNHCAEWFFSDSKPVSLHRMHFFSNGTILQCTACRQNWDFYSIPLARYVRTGSVLYCCPSLYVPSSPLFNMFSSWWESCWFCTTSYIYILHLWHNTRDNVMYTVSKRQEARHWQSKDRGGGGGFVLIKTY